MRSLLRLRFLDNHGNKSTAKHGVDTWRVTSSLLPLFDQLDRDPRPVRHECVALDALELGRYAAPELILGVSPFPQDESVDVLPILLFLRRCACCVPVEYAVKISQNPRKDEPRLAVIAP